MHLSESLLLWERESFMNVYFKKILTDLTTTYQFNFVHSLIWIYQIEYVLGPQFLLGASDDDDVDAGAFFYLFLKDVKKMKENDDMLQIIWKGRI